MQPLRRFSAAEAYNSLKANPNGEWPRRDDPDNRFAHFADPAFEPSFVLTPGQRIFTIGSCFARGIENALAKRGFDIPTLAFAANEREWGGDPMAILNNYIPPAIAPQIRWAFGLEEFDIDKHTAQMRPGRYVDLQCLSFRPLSADEIRQRRDEISAIYRQLASSHVVVITLGLIEAWYDHRSNSYINCAPPKSCVQTEPARFELHVLEYNQVLAALRELATLLDQVCPRDYRMIMTVSPVPLTATFTAADVAVANTYSKAVLRTATEALVAERPNVDYFPSYESVVLTERSLAFIDDQVHVSGTMIKFNVDRMIRRYIPSSADESAGDALTHAQADMQNGLFGSALKTLQHAWTEHPDDPKIVTTLAAAQLRAGNGKSAESLLLKFLESREHVRARVQLARYYNDTGRYAEAALHAEKAAEDGKMRVNVLVQRVIAYYHLGRYAEGLALAEKVKEQNTLLIYWKARFCERLGRIEDAEEFYRFCTGLDGDITFGTDFARFLATQERWDEVSEWVDRILIDLPEHAPALRLRAEVNRARRGTQTTPNGSAMRAGTVDSEGLSWRDYLRGIAGAIAARRG